MPSANGPIEGLEEAKKGKEIFFQKACLIKNNCYFCTRFDKQPSILIVGLLKELKQVQLKQEDTFIDILD